MATILKYVGETTGGNRPMLFDAKIKNKKNFRKGDLVFGTDLEHYESSVSGFYGIAAEDYEKEENELCPGYGKGILKVNRAFHSVFKTDAVYITACEDYEMFIKTTDIQVEGTNGSDCCFGLILVEKGAGSANPHEIGKFFSVSGVNGDSDTGGSVLVTGNSGKSYAGDKYMLVPYAGSKHIHLKTPGKIVYDCNSEGNLEILEVDTNEKTYTVKIRNNA